MKDRSILTSIGILSYLIVSIIDRFFYKIPDYIYILIVVIAIIVWVIGFMKDRNK